MAVAISCQSEGALQVYIEPVIPTPHLTIVGRSPMAHTLAELAGALGWRADVRDGSEFSAAELNASSIVVVATQGHGDEEAVEQAVSALPAFVGLVASRRRGEAVLGTLADRGVPRHLLDRVRVPVGLDLGHTSHREIAVAILAELVQRRAAGEFSPGRRTSAPRPRPHPGGGGGRGAEAVDPVCGMTVRADASGQPFEHDGITYYFCCAGCRASFAKEPDAYLTATAHPGGLMLIKNNFEVAQPVDKVWKFFDDIPQVAACLPGTQLTEDLGDNKYNGMVAIRMGPVKLQFAGTAQIKERDDAAKRIVVDAAGADEKGRGQAAMPGTASLVAGSRRDPGRRRAGPAAVRRRPRSTAAA